MIHDYERYHGVVLRDLVVSAPGPLKIEKQDGLGRVASFRINGKTLIHLKHSSKRLAPWQFTFNTSVVAEVKRLEKAGKSLWMALICGSDGVVVLSKREFWTITATERDVTRFIRVNRDRHTQYRVFGNAGNSPTLKARGVSAIIEDAFGIKVR